MSDSAIKGQDLPVCKIFNDDYLLRIPLYQRPYSWKEEHAGELFDDLRGFAIEPGPVDKLNPYFLGSVVVVKEKPETDTEVVDGQQRLTTLTILLSAIRSLLTGHDAAGLTSILYQKGVAVLGTKDRFRLTLRPQDAPFFQKYIQIEGQLDNLRALDPGMLSDSQKNIQLNANLFVDLLRKLPLDACLRLAQFVLTRCFLVVVSTADKNSAFRIFSILNSRGMDLSLADILKSEILGGIPTSKVEEYGKRWENAEEELGREEFAELLSHVRTIFRKVKAKEAVLKEFREYVIKPVTDSAELLDEVVLPYADAYGVIHKAAYVSAAGLRPSTTC